MRGLKREWCPKGSKGSFIFESGYERYDVISIMVTLGRVFYNVGRKG